VLLVKSWCCWSKAGAAGQKLVLLVKSWCCWSKAGAAGQKLAGAHDATWMPLQLLA